MLKIARVILFSVKREFTCGIRQQQGLNYTVGLLSFCRMTISTSADGS